MRIKDEKIYKLWGFTEKFDFWGWFMKKNNKQGGFSKKGGLGQLVYLRGGLAKKRMVFLRRTDTQMHVMGN